MGFARTAEIDDMTGLELQRALKDGKRVYGTCIISQATRWLDLVPGIGLDFVFIDTEHIPIDRGSLSWMCRAYKELGVAPIVRVPSTDPIQASMALDAGAMGVIAPYVETAKQAQDLVGAVKYRPLKHQRLQSVLSGEDTLDPETKRYLDKNNEGRLVVVNIESQAALDALDEILEVEGVDSVLIGPHDLSCSLGVPEQYDHPKFDEAVKTIFRKARARGVGAGYHSWLGIEKHAEWIEAGANFIIYSTDVYLFAHTLKRDLKALKAAVGDSEDDAEALDGTL